MLLCEHHIPPHKLDKTNYCGVSFTTFFKIKPKAMGSNNVFNDKYVLSMANLHNYYWNAKNSPGSHHYFHTAQREHIPQQNGPQQHCTCFWYDFHNFSERNSWFTKRYIRTRESMTMNTNVWFYKISIPHPRRATEIPRGGGLIGEISEGEGTGKTPQSLHSRGFQVWKFWGGGGLKEKCPPWGRYGYFLEPHNAWNCFIYQE